MTKTALVVSSSLLAVTMAGSAATAAGGGHLVTSSSQSVTTSAPQVQTPQAPALVLPPAVDMTAGTGVDTVPFPGSFWSTPLAPDAPLDPRSAALGADIARQVAQSRAQYGLTPNLSTTSYATPVFRAGLTQAAVSVGACPERGSSSWMDAWSAALGKVPIPAGAKPAVGTDASIVVWQQSTDTVWELWQAREAADGTWSACWGGKLAHASTSSGVFAAPYGVSASGLSLLGGVVTPAEVRAGAIHHALTVALPLTSTEPVAPANRADGHGPTATTVSEGARIRLPADYPVTGTPVQQVFIQALKTYGAVVQDTNGGVMAFDGEDTLLETGTDAWPATLGQPTWTVFDTIDWSKVEVVDPSVQARAVSAPVTPAPAAAASAVVLPGAVTPAAVAPAAAVPSAVRPAAVRSARRPSSTPVSSASMRTVLTLFRL